MYNTIIWLRSLGITKNGHIGNILLKISQANSKIETVHTKLYDPRESSKITTTILILRPICYIQTPEIEFYFQSSDANSSSPIYSHVYISDSDICTLCNLNDEYHYVLICPFFKHSRTMYLKPYFYTRPRLYKF